MTNDLHSFFKECEFLANKRPEEIANAEIVLAQKAAESFSS